MEDYPYDQKGLVLRDGDLAVLNVGGRHLCGYCTFKKGEIPDEWRGDYDVPGLQFLCIHGGPTYADDLTFGFDCAHAGDDENPALRDPQHVLALAKQMREQMLELAAVWPEFKAASQDKRIEMVQAIRERAAITTDYGLGGMIGLMLGTCCADKDVEA